MATAVFESVWDAPIPAMDAQELVDRFQMLEQERRIVEAELAAVLVEVDRREVFRDDQHASVKGWARALGKWSDGEARARSRVARLSQALPQVAEALGSGLLGVAQVHELGRAFSNPRVSDQLGDVVDIFLTHAEHMPFESFQQMVKQWESIADADGAHRDHEISHRRRRASIYVLGTSVILQACGGAADGAEMIEILERYQQAEFQADWDHARATHGADATAAQLPRDAAQRAWDALVHVFRDAASTAAGAQAPEPVLNIVADQQTFTEALQDFARLLSAVDGVDGKGTIAEFLAEHLPDLEPEPESAPEPEPEPEPEPAASGSLSPWPQSPSSAPVRQGPLVPPPVVRPPAGRSPDPRWWRCATVGGVPLPRSVIIEALLVGQVRRVVIDGAGVAVDVGRKRRFFTGPMREAIMMLTDACVWAGCSRPSRQSVADHTTDFQHGGHTSTHNGGPMCDPHNLRKNSGYEVWRDPGGYWHTFRPDGTEIR